LLIIQLARIGFNRWLFQSEMLRRTQLIMDHYLTAEKLETRRSSNLLNHSKMGLSANDHKDPFDHPGVWRGQGWTGLIIHPMNRFLPKSGLPHPPRWGANKTRSFVSIHYTLPAKFIYILRLSRVNEAHQLFSLADQETPRRESPLHNIDPSGRALMPIRPLKWRVSLRLFLRIHLAWYN